VQVGGGIEPTVTVPAQVLVEPVPLSMVRLQVCVAVGETVAEPLGVVNVPLPRLSVQV
jgi:hypothetical protein